MSSEGHHVFLDRPEGPNVGHSNKYYLWPTSYYLLVGFPPSARNFHKEMLEDYEAEKQYCGPGSLTLPATQATNRACYEHDRYYGELGKKAYFLHNRADNEFLSKLYANWKNGELGGTGYVAGAVFGIKKILAPHYMGGKRQSQLAFQYQKKRRILAPGRKYGYIRKLSGARRTYSHVAKAHGFYAKRGANTYFKRVGYKRRGHY